MTQEVLKLALDALENLNAGLVPHKGEWCSIQSIAIAAIKEALAQPEQEPMAWYCCFQGQEEGEFFLFGSPNSERYPSQYKTPLYEHLPQRTWVGLTDVEIDYLLGSTVGENEETHISFARAIESKLKELNT